ncbi:phage major capsid protein [Clostridium sp. P21]|uniref:Phage major capsid protein n=1 Tax=Clostridium muellerianum TaxID=2716538 RepID=A0A7Y0HRR8_9CLOT|nr:phage major capsid protein [Clostridium muellerianum]NMM65491.1 phage major capsid protein [Clostridium muellerianum]
MKIEELRQEIATKTEELGKKIESRDVEGAKTLKEEIRQAKELLKLAEEQEVEEKRELDKQKNAEKRGNKNMEKVSEFRSVVKHVMGKEKLTEEERAMIKTSDHSAVIPKQFINDIIELEKGYGSLEGLCDVIPVTKNDGTIPVIDLEQGEDLKEVVEGDAITDGTLVTTDIPFKCSKVGLLQKITSETIDDAEVEIENLVRKNFVIKTVANKNARIMKVLNDNATVIPGTSYEDVHKEIDKSLPSVKNGLINITNVTTYAELKNMKDKQGRNLDLITVIGGQEYFGGKPLYVVEDTSLAPTTKDKKFVVLIANAKEAVKFPKRNEITVAKSQEAGFTTDSVYLRILGRFGVVKGVTRSIKKIEF